MRNQRIFSNSHRRRHIQRHQHKMLNRRQTHFLQSLENQKNVEQDTNI